MALIWPVDAELICTMILVIKTLKYFLTDESIAPTSGAPNILHCLSFGLLHNAETAGSGPALWQWLVSLYMANAYVVLLLSSISGVIFALRKNYKRLADCFWSQRQQLKSIQRDNYQNFFLKKQTEQLVLDNLFSESFTKITDSVF